MVFKARASPSASAAAHGRPKAAAAGEHSEAGKNEVVPVGRRKRGAVTKKCEVKSV